MRSKVLLDTNFLVDVVSLRIDLYGELDRIMSSGYELVTVPGVETELDTLSKGGDIHAKTALELITMGKIRMMETINKGDVDEIIVELCKHDNTIVVATNDGALKRRLSSIKAKYIYVRARKHLAID